MSWNKVELVKSWVQKAHWLLTVNRPDPLLKVRVGGIVVDGGRQRALMPREPLREEKVPDARYKMVTDFSMVTGFRTEDGHQQGFGPETSLLARA